MQNRTDSITPNCKFLGCENIAKHSHTDTFWDYCDYHFDGGYFGSGESYEQYQVIEQDFIDFIKMVPIDDDEHLKGCTTNIPKQHFLQQTF